MMDIVCKKLAFFLGIPDVNCSGSQNSEHTRLPRNVSGAPHAALCTVHGRSPIAKKMW